MLQMETKLQTDLRVQDREFQGPKSPDQALTLQWAALVWREYPGRELALLQAMAGLKRLVEVPKLAQELGWGWVLTMRAEVGAPGWQERLAALPAVEDEAEQPSEVVLVGLVRWTIVGRERLQRKLAGEEVGGRRPFSNCSVKTASTSGRVQR